jgi:hypothetical protein
VRYYRLDRTEGGPLPAHDRLKVGAIIRVPRSNSRKPGAQWNPDTGNWVTPIWVECDNPQLAVKS